MFIRQGKEYKTGEVIIQGNDITQQKVARRPDRGGNQTARWTRSRWRTASARIKTGQHLRQLPRRITAQKPSDEDPLRRAGGGGGDQTPAISASAPGRQRRGIPGSHLSHQRNFDARRRPTLGQSFFSRRTRSRQPDNYAAGVARRRSSRTASRPDRATPSLNPVLLGRGPLWLNTTGATASAARNSVGARASSPPLQSEQIAMGASDPHSACEAGPHQFERVAAMTTRSTSTTRRGTHQVHGIRYQPDAVDSDDPVARPGAPRSTWALAGSTAPPPTRCCTRSRSSSRSRRFPGADNHPFVPRGRQPHSGKQRTTLPDQPVSTWQPEPAASRSRRFRFEQ